MKGRSFSFNWIVVALLLVIAVITPFILKGHPYYVHIFILVFLFGYLSTAWGLVGQSGQLSFGHAVFVGLWTTGLAPGSVC
jgi:ABC-type branched-subunit amino acid transport system permease subunit